MNFELFFIVKMCCVVVVGSLTVHLLNDMKSFYMIFSPFNTISSSNIMRVFNILFLCVCLCLWMSLMTKWLRFLERMFFVSAENVIALMEWMQFEWKCQNDVKSETHDVWSAVDLMPLNALNFFCDGYGNLNESRIKAWSRCKLCQNVSFLTDSSLVGSWECVFWQNYC